MTIKNNKNNNGENITQKKNNYTKLSFLVLLVLSVVTMTAFSGCMSDTGATDGPQTQSTGSSEPIRALVGAGMQIPMDEIAEVYEQKYGVKIEYDYSGSGALYSKIVASNSGDIFMPGDSSYIFKLQESKGYVAKYENITKHVPVIAVQKGNPKNIQCLDDLAKDDVKLSLGEKSIAIGKTFNKILAKAETKGLNITSKVKENTLVEAGTVKQTLMYVCQKQADAAVVWRADALSRSDEVDVIEIDPQYNTIKTIPVAILTTSDNPNTEKFYEFIITEGLPIFEKNGFVLLNDTNN
ncbi:molybdate ABC transporter substrate-binding protein [Methanococcus voltae]|uniref:Molybdate transport system substrate-binding protein n=2 Tax=Methanococcus voltae TaxID=2188 RepID=A0A8J7UT29_METVO|nr:molybdate ABC transporter substrate-binding protein [Methanococcus voltae]MBP2171813.1 molybdate transport system substrate-binding protein [Methanococcus voltae]MBP2201249.1 molybdate transport system substrate-binding protein [Methanococcus voltae]MCS3922809.1 molybdate transport system substrate-binding protein [Methanococcus voltae PS]